MGTVSLAMLRRAAEDGNGEAQYALADRYRRGDGVALDLDVARRWLSQAAIHGHADAQNDLGSMLVNAMGGPKDSEVAAAWYERAAEQGHADAQFNLALRYLHGDGVEGDAAEAATWLWLAMAQRHIEATCELGTLFRFGRGVSQSFKVAGFLHLQAAKGGDPVAYGNLSDYLHEIVALALAGDVQSALVMAEINASGFGIDTDQIQSLAWVLAIGTSELPFADDDNAERQQHLELLTQLTSVLCMEDQAEAHRRSGQLRAQAGDRADAA
jgi:TPR repeat protein